MEETKRQCWNQIAELLKTVADSQPTEREKYIVRAVSGVIWGHPEMYVPFPGETNELGGLTAEGNTL